MATKCKEVQAGPAGKCKEVQARKCKGVQASGQPGRARKYYEGLMPLEVQRSASKVSGDLTLYMDWQAKKPLGTA